MLALEILAEFIEEPQRAARLAAERRAWPLALACLAASALSLFVAQAVSRRFLPAGVGPLSLVAACAWMVATGFLLAATLHLIADAAGFRGSGTALFALLAMSQLAWALVLPAALILRAARVDSWPAVLALLAAAGLLSLRLKARSIRHVYGISAPRAWALLAAPYALLFLAVSGAIAAAVIGATVSIARMLG